MQKETPKTSINHREPTPILILQAFFFVFSLFLAIFLPYKPKYSPKIFFFLFFREKKNHLAVGIFSIVLGVSCRILTGVLSLQGYFELQNRYRLLKCGFDDNFLIFHVFFNFFYYSEFKINIINILLIFIIICLFC